MSKIKVDTYVERFKKRSLPELLVHKFLTEYGYDHGPVIARAIVDDILATVEQCYPEHLPPKTVVWLAVRRGWNGRRKNLELTDLVFEAYEQGGVLTLLDLSMLSGMSEHYAGAAATQRSLERVQQRWITAAVQ